MFRLDEYENTVERVTVQDALNVSKIAFEENHQAQRRKTRERQEGLIGGILAGPSPKPPPVKARPPPSTKTPK